MMLTHCGNNARNRHSGCVFSVKDIVPVPLKTSRNPNISSITLETLLLIGPLEGKPTPRLALRLTCFCSLLALPFLSFWPIRYQGSPHETEKSYAKSHPNGRPLSEDFAEAVH